ncbi:MAG TPA: hypothetical protein VFO76_08095, partial [Candidatus Kapabacteria bacterium]|nr:hypothetical protein [Candidatus Kapabacteria bacterium]
MQSYTVRVFQALVVLIVAFGYDSAIFAQSSDHCGTEATLRYNLARAKSGLSIEAAPLMQSSIVSPSGKFKILFDTSGQNVTTKSYVDSVAKFADEAYLLEIDTLGYKQPPFSYDDNMWYIYLVDKGSSGIYGVTIQATQSPFGESASGLPLFKSYIQIDNDFPDSVFKTHGIDGARITVFHEFHHVIQFGSLGLGTLTSDVNFREMTSVWLEMRSTPWVKDYLQYVPKYLKN